MRFLFWRLERAEASRVTQTRVRIELQRSPQTYSYQWFIDEKQGRTLNKREIHELDMRVAKYVASLNSNPPAQAESTTVFTSLESGA